MRLFRTHRESARLTNRTIGWFFLVMLAVTLAFGAILLGHYGLHLW